MRKILILFVLTVMLLALTSCELLFSFFTEKHTHSYDSAWSYNTSEHYYSCQCGDIADLESHVDIDSLDGKCDVCGFKMHNVYTVTLVVGENINAKANHFSVVDGDTLSFLVTVPPKHTISVEGASTVGEPVLNSTGLGYVYTIRVEDVIADVTVFIEAWEVKPPCNHESVRYPTCTESGLCLLCGDNIGEAIGHRYSEPTCNKLSECSVCGDTVGDYAPHRWLDPTCSQPYLCTECGEMRGEALGHTGGAPNCDDAGICSRCSVEYISPLGHSWKDATCTTAKTCTVCGETEDKPLGHAWKDATCTTAKTCTVCGETEGKPLGHAWKDATCTTAKTCTECGIVNGTPLGHAWKDATCTTAKTCTECGETEGKPLGHSWKDATCTTAKTCTVCEEIEGKPLGHSWKDATCTTAKTCTECGETEGKPLGHNWKDATCTVAKTCTECGETEGKPLGHSWKDATCTVAKTCTVCEEIEGKPLGHAWKDATCTTAKTCTECGETEGKPLGHAWKDATCTTAKTCTECGIVNGTPLGHAWKDATCTVAKTCTECGETEGKPLGHAWKDATCTMAKTCTVCEEIEGKPLGHSWKDATCTTAKTCTVCEEIEGKPLGHSWKDATCTTAKTCTECGQVIGVALSHTLAYESLGDGTHKVYCVHIGCDLSYVEMCDGEPSLTEAAFCSICKAHYGDPLPPNESEGDNTLSVTIGDDNCAYTSIMVDSDGRYYFSISYDTEQYPESMPYVTIDLYGDGDHIELGEYADLTAGVRYSVRIIFYSGEDVEITYSQNQDESDTEDSYRVKRELLIGEDYSDKVEVTVEVSGLYVFNIEYDQKYIESPPYVTIIEDGGYIEYDVTYNVWLDAGVNYILSAIFYVGESVTVTLCLT